MLVTGETGSGKSTSLAALLDFINHTRKAHIVTLEDPVEYIYTPDKCAINQREVGKDTMSFAAGLRASLREDPNVILIGEMRDRETIETAITAAETGHLVFGTLHTGSASDAVDRIVQVFPEGMQTQIRLQLSMCLQAVLTQQLIPKKGGGRALAVEMMVVNDAIRNLIRNGNTPRHRRPDHGPGPGAPGARRPDFQGQRPALRPRDGVRAQERIDHDKHDRSACGEGHAAAALGPPPHAPGTYRIERR